MAFDDWYETYERDGGELMLYNTIDLEMAYGAGQRAGYLEGMEAADTKDGIGLKWYSKGYSDGMVKAAEIAEAGFQSAILNGNHIYNYNSGRCDAANAIRREIEHDQTR